MSRDTDRTRDHRVVPWLLLGLLLGLLLALGAAYVAVYYVTSDRIPRGTTVAGVEVGGQTPARAQPAHPAAVRNCRPAVESRDVVYDGPVVSVAS